MPPFGEANKGDNMRTTKLIGEWKNDMITESTDASAFPFDVYVNDVMVAEFHQPMGLKKHCSDLFPMGKGTFILEDGTRVHGSKIKQNLERNAKGELHLTLKD